MKRLLLVTSFLTICFFPRAQITWDGGGDGTSWHDASNWVGDIIPGKLDNVLLDNSVIPGNYTVTLGSGAVTDTIVSLTIFPTTGNTIRLLMPTLNTVTAGAFVTTGSGYSIIINDGGIFDNNSGVTSGTNLTINDSIRINNGGKYIHRTRSGHAAWTIRLSRVNGTEFGVFEFDVPSALGYAISTATSRVYPTLVLSSAEAGGTKSYTSNAGGSPVVNGNLVINSGVTYSYTPPAAGVTFLVNHNCVVSSSSTLNISASGINTMTFQLKGDLVNNGTIRETGASTSTSLEFNGNTNQSISGTGLLLDTITVNINNSSGVTINDPLTLPYYLALTDGKITTTSTNLLTMVDNATYTGGSVTSFIDGPMKKRGDDDFLFPIGKGGILAPIGISGGTGAAATDEFTAEYIRSNPQGVHGGCPANCVPGLDHISFVEYWTLDRNAGSASKQVSLTVHSLSFCKVMASTYVSKWDGAQWTNEATTISAGPVACGAGMQCGIITTTSPITSFSDFTFATDLPYITNPLPVKLITFNAQKVNSTTAHITWELADICLRETIFEIQRSADGRNFSSIATLPGNETGKQYFHLDPQLEKGITYYRLKIMEPGAAIVYSRTVAIINDSRGLLITSVSPNPVQGTSYISISTAKAGLVQLELYNISGQRVMQYTAPVAEGNNTIPLNMQQLPHGIYQLQAIIGTDRSSYRVVK